MATSSHTETLDPPDGLTNQKYKYDNNLHTYPKDWHSIDSPANEVSPIGLLHKFPMLEEFGQLACLSYKPHHNRSHSRKISERLNELPTTWKFLVCARNTSCFNGYYGTAYINNATRQIIVSHRGTKITNFGALIADLQGVCRIKRTQQAVSAMTFASKIVKFADQNHFEVFFTGHSLGAWLAEVTCFSTIYLTTNEHFFFQKPPPHPFDRWPYTVVFESPGAQPFLQKMKDNLFPTNKEINVCFLPVDVFQSKPNLINTCNLAVGSVYALNRRGSPRGGRCCCNILGLGCHKQKYVMHLLSSLEDETDAWTCLVVKHRLNSTLDVLWKDPNDVRLTELTRANELTVNNFKPPAVNVLQLLHESHMPGSFQRFEGVNSSVESLARSLIPSMNSDGRSLIYMDKLRRPVVHCGQNNRQEFIPRVHSMFMYVLHGHLWYNPWKPQLPQNYVDRKVTWSGDPGRTFNLQELVCTRDRFVLLADLPGSGKSSALIKLEMDLRDGYTKTHRVIVHVNLNNMQEQMHERPEEQCLMSFLQNYAPHIPWSKLTDNSNIPVAVYILIDGPDEIFPVYEKTMSRKLRMISEFLQPSATSLTRHGLIRLESVIVSTRPYIHNYIKQQFNIQTVSLRSLTIDQRLQATNRRVGDWVRFVRSNPYMSFLYTQLFNSQRFSTTAILDVNFDVNSHFINKEHEIYLKEKEFVDFRSNVSKTRLTCIFEDNLRRYYYFLARQAFLPEYPAATLLESEGWLLEPKGDKLEALLRIGHVVINTDNRPTFRHESYAEYFYAHLIKDPKTPQPVKDALLREIEGTDYHHNIVNFWLNQPSIDNISSPLLQ